MASRAAQSGYDTQKSRLGADAIERVISAGVILAIAAAVGFGWLHRGDGTLDPERGIGYALGIIGGIMMLVLLGYPLRKRMRARGRSMGSVGFWFRFHMLLGLLGPLAVLYHCRFSWGAMNSAVALGAMIIVASSGLIGRFLYSRVHRGYSDRKLELRALKQEMEAMLDSLASYGVPRELVVQELQPFENRAVAAGGAFWSSAAAVIGLGIATRQAERRIAALLPRGARRSGDPVRQGLAHYFEAVRRAAEFAFYDRLLRLWHLLHLPLFVLLVAAAILHVIAVHMY